MNDSIQPTSSVYSPFPLLSRLSLMMFLQYFVQGAYLPIASVYVQDALGFTSMQVGIFSSALAVGPFLAPFVIGQIVDRMFATERVMAFCHLAGGLLMLAIYTQAQVWPVILLGTAYSILYVPTMMLSNSLAFQHLKNSDMEFPWVRLFGTLGYIIPAYVIEFWWLRGLQGESLDRARAFAFALSGIVGVLMAIYCLTLPRTPAQQREDRKYAPGVVISMLRSRHFFVLILVSFFIAMAHQFVVVWYSPFVRAILDTGDWGAYEQSISSVGQICELGVLAVLGLLIKRLGFKWTMLLGITAYLLRCLLFSLVFGLDLPFAGKLALAAAGQALHGFCFGCFLAVAYMYVDRIAPRDVRGSMQTLYGTFVIALGFFAGGMVSGQIGEWFTSGAGEAIRRDWTSIWLSCAGLCAACLVVFAAYFPKKLPETSET
ncbi:MAG: MFS transporter [Pirellulales bacterium]|nr:MFS transporter [Pirellulales bacterium]